MAQTADISDLLAFYKKHELNGIAELATALNEKGVDEITLPRTRTIYGILGPFHLGKMGKATPIEQLRECSEELANTPRRNALAFDEQCHVAAEILRSPTVDISDKIR